MTVKRKLVALEALQRAHDAIEALLEPLGQAPVSDEKSEPLASTARERPRRLA